MPVSERSSTFTVTQAMNTAKRSLEQISLTVIGEVSEVNAKQGYRAAYFTIHDDTCSMPCIMWRDKYRAAGIDLQVGMLIEVKGNFSCYPVKGTMQFSVTSLTLAGEGRLRMQVALLAKKLQTEGLMDASRKRRPTALPQRIAVVTSPRGKAIHDVMRTLRRRYPLGELLIFGVPVEGKDAPSHIARGLQAAISAQPAPDVILLVRGGGSYEDLMPFNDESLARIVASSPVPIVTGIGHEPDNSICDMVADVRCSTPTAAAEAIAPSLEELSGKVGNARAALNNALANYLQIQSSQLGRLADRPVWQDAHYISGPYIQTLDIMAERLKRALPDALSADMHALDLLSGRLYAMGSQVCARCGREVALNAAKLDALSPLKTLARGYSITYAQDGKQVIGSVKAASVGAPIQVQLQDGKLDCTVDAIERGKDE